MFVVRARGVGVVPFEPAERLAPEMEARGRTVSFLLFAGVGRFPDEGGAVARRRRPGAETPWSGGRRRRGPAPPPP